MNETCVCCGATVPEGRQVCPNCEKPGFLPDAFLEDGTPLYFKTTSYPSNHTPQLLLYRLLNGGKL